MGIVKLSNIKYEQDFQLINEQITMNFNSDDLKKYDIKKLTSSNPQFLVDEQRICIFNSITSSEKALLQFEFDYATALLLSEEINGNIEFINENTGITLKNNNLESSLKEMCEKLKV